MDTEYISETMDETLIQSTLSPVTKTEYEALQQELHETKNSLIRSQSLNKGMEVEMDVLKKIISEFELKVEKKEAEFAITLSNRVSVLQSNLDEVHENYQKVISDLKGNFSKLQHSEKKGSSEDGTEELTKKLSSFSEEIYELNEKLHEAKILNDKSEEQKESLQKHIKILEEKVASQQLELEETREIVKEKDLSLKSTMNALHDIQEEKALLSCELNSLKVGPIGELHRGNSLFSEVEDKRKSLETKFLALKKKYIQMKSLIVAKTNENDKLEKENLKLRCYSQEDEKLATSQYNQHQRSLQQRIEELNKIIRDLEKRPENPQIITISDTDLSQLKWVHTVVEKARSEARELRNELIEKTALQMNLADQLFVSQHEIRSFKLKSMKYEAQIKELEIKISKLETIEDTTIAKEDMLPDITTEAKYSVIQQTTRGIRFADEVKENDGGNSLKDFKRCTKVVPLKNIEIFSNKNYSDSEKVKDYSD